MTQEHAARGGTPCQTGRDLGRPTLQQPRFLPVPVAFLLGLALVVQLLALGERQFQLCAALVVEVDLQGHQRHAFAIDAGAQAVDLALVQQQFPAAARLMVEAVGLQIFRQMGIDEPDFIALVRGIGFGNIRLAFAQRLDLGAGQHQSCLIGVDDFVVEPGLAVFRNDLVHHALAASGAMMF
ncbi:hypothetical protein AT6N2_C1334 [Agrobacterium tumefaciens]|nr:hypothetical protein AT6N2_C1334 [Agrobacterium tumefaciens]